MKAIRGATTVEQNAVDDIARATCDLLAELQRRNALRMEEVVSVFFSLTDDLDAAYPATAARAAGWDVPMLDLQQARMAEGLKRCIRVLVHVDRTQPVRHVYLGDAVRLRPDLEEGA